tara:strand:+ start:361 stop:573 length:213 start_codon:yes stop_codon:yes gene_type:complete
MLELTVFIRVRIDNLNAFSRLIPDIVNIDDNNVRDNIKIITEIKNLLILIVSNVESENSSLLMKTFKGRA